MGEKTESIILNVPTKTTTDPDDFPGEFYQTYMEGITSIVYISSQNMKEEGTLLNSFYNSSIRLILNPEKDSGRKENYRLTSLMNVDTENPL